MLFAQINRNEKVASEGVAVVLGFLCVIIIVYFAVMIFFLLTLHKLLKKCRSRNRTMEPGQVWLNLIPCFQLVWQFITVVRIEETLKEEFRERGLGRRRDSYGKAIGMAACIIGIVANVVGKMGDAADKINPQQGEEFHALDYLSWILMVVTLILFVTYWIKMAGYSRQLSASNLDDDFDDRPRRRRSRDDWDDDRDDRDDQYDRRRRDEWDDDNDDRR